MWPACLTLRQPELPTQPPPEWNPHVTQSSPGLASDPDSGKGSPTSSKSTQVAPITVSTRPFVDHGFSWSKSSHNQKRQFHI